MRTCENVWAKLTSKRMIKYFCIHFRLRSSVIYFFLCTKFLLKFIRFHIVYLYVIQKIKVIKQKYFSSNETKEYSVHVLKWHLKENKKGENSLDTPVIKGTAILKLLKIYLMQKLKFNFVLIFF